MRWLARNRLGEIRPLLFTIGLSLAVATTAEASTGVISTVAGSTAGLGGDGGRATLAQLSAPAGVAPTPDGGYLIADTNNHRIRRVSVRGTIRTVAGSTQGISGDGGPATAAQLEFPRSVAPTSDGGFLIADTAGRIRKVSSSGTITTVAGTTPGFSGDSGPAIAAKLDFPTAATPTPDGGFLIADANNNRIRKVSASGTITTVAGTTAGLSGDGGPATAAQLDFPEGVAPTIDGGFLIADAHNHRIRKVSASGSITTVAGTTQGLSGDGGKASAARLNNPTWVAPTLDRGFLIADERNSRIRKVTAAGTIRTVAGSTPGLSGDGDRAARAQLNIPTGVAVAPDGGFLVTDTFNFRIRRVEGWPAPSQCGGTPFFVIDGSSAADSFAGTVVRDSVAGGKGRDMLRGGKGADCLLGQRGNDHLRGGPGNDRLVGGPGHDVLYCGSGAHDVAIGEARDLISRTCEEVRRPE